MQPLAILFGAAFTVLTATALGTLLLGDRCRDYPLRFVVGSALLSVLVFFSCAVHLVYPICFLAVGGVSLLASGAWLGKKQGAKKITFSVTNGIFIVVFTAYFILYFFNSMAPEASPDGATYHLGFVSRYLLGHGFHRITWSLYADLSAGAEMLFLFAFAFGKHSAAAMVHFCFLIALVWEMILYGRRAGFALPATCAAVLVASSQVVGVDATSAYNDVALAAAAFALFVLLHCWESEREPRLLLAIGLVAGFAYAVKYTGFVAVLYAVGFVAWKSRRLRELLVVASGAAAIALPWIVKNWIWLGNPFAPFFNQYFPNPYITIAFEKDYKAWLTLYDLPSRWQIPWEVTGKGNLGGILGPVFLLSPLALLALRHKQGRRLLLGAAVFGATYFSNIGTRFLIPPLPFVALALMLVLATIPGLAVAVAVLHAVMSWPGLVPKYCPPQGWQLARRIPWREALRRRDPDQYLRKRRVDYGAARMVESLTPPNATVFMYREIPWAYTTRRVLVEYESAENERLGTIVRAAFQPDLAPTLRLRWVFPRRALRGLRVVTTAPSSDQWSIKELRILNGEDELPRLARWRLTAHPFPWTIQDAFDNSPVTFWRSGEMVRPGMFVEVDFGGQETADGVLIDAPPNAGDIRLRLEGRDLAGNWVSLADAPASLRLPAPLGLRRAASSELKRRGVDYILVLDEEFCAAEFRDNAGLWGVRQIGETGGARLYQLP
jgi:hypothetical protein